MQHLIFDIGMNRGQDTEYYLWLNHHVVAIDADPTLAKLVRAKFSKQVENGQLQVVNCAIAPDEGAVLDFYISEKDEWNSFKKEVAERKNAVKDVVQVKSRRLASLMVEYGVPYYCKIDIEGYDEIALDTLVGVAELPKYISVETECAGDERLSDQQALITLDKLYKLGYRKFKLVDQATLTVLDPNQNFYTYGHLFVRVLDKIARSINPTWTVGERKKAINRANFPFPLTSSGFFGEALAGTWHDYATSRDMLLKHRNDYFRLPTAVSYGFWCDWHSTY